MQSLVIGKPSLLIALPQLQDPNFVKTVVLLLEYDDQGAIGFVINKMSSFSLNEIASEDIVFPVEIPAWIGGPVGAERGIFVHNYEAIESDGCYHHDIKITSSIDSMKRLIEFSSHQANHSDIYPYRFLVGYAGWGKNQLDNEIKSGAWIQTEFDAELVFNTPWKHMWSQAIHSLGCNPINIAPTQQAYLN